MCLAVAGAVGSKLTKSGLSRELGSSISRNSVVHATDIDHLSLVTRFSMWVVTTAILRQNMHQLKNGHTVRKPCTLSPQRLLTDWKTTCNILKCSHLIHPIHVTHLLVYLFLNKLPTQLV